MRRSIIALAAALAPIASPAVAQDGSEASSKRSVEGAQRFLANLVAGGGASSSYVLGTQKSCVSRCRGNEGLVVRTYAIWQVDRLEPLSRCATRIHYKPGSARLWSDYVINSRYKTVPPVAYVDIDWSQSGGHDDSYTKDAQAGHRILFGANHSPIYGNMVKLSFLDAPAETNQRISAAIDYLVENCSVPSQTGF